MSANEVVIGVDLGGTNVRAAAFDRQGNPIGPRIEAPSHAQSGLNATIESVFQTVERAIAAAPTVPCAVGMAIPGRVDDEEGRILWAPNFGMEKNGVFECWLDIPMRELLKKRISLPIRMGNDANLAALGEYRYGCGRNKARCLVMLTLGTGIGGGVVLAPYALQGKVSGPVVLLGGNRGGAELGHICVQFGGLDCNAGTYGALEAYCQRDAIVRRAVHRLGRGRKSSIVDKVQGDLSLLTPKLLSEAAHEGDELAIQVWEEVGTYLGAGIGSLINVFAPDVFALGGQVSKAGDFLLKPAIRAARDIAIATLFADTTITVAEREEDAGLLGAAALAFEDRE